MKKSLSQQSEKFSWKSVLLSVMIVALSGSVILYFEKIQEKIFPVKYWEQKVEKLRADVAQDSWKIKNFSIQLEKEKTLQNFFLQEAAMKAESDKKNVEEELSLAKKAYQQKLEAIKQEISFMENDKETKERQLLDMQEKKHLAEMNKEKSFFHF
jgi:multidrug resistance efflux pump